MKFDNVVLELLREEILHPNLSRNTYMIRDREHASTIDRSILNGSKGRVKEAKVKMENECFHSWQIVSCKE